MILGFRAVDFRSTLGLSAWFTLCYFAVLPYAASIHMVDVSSVQNDLLNLILSTLQSNHLDMLSPICKQFWLPLQSRGVEQTLLLLQDTFDVVPQSPQMRYLQHQLAHVVGSLGMHSLLIQPTVTNQSLNTYLDDLNNLSKRSIRGGTGVFERGAIIHGAMWQAIASFDHYSLSSHDLSQFIHMLCPVPLHDCVHGSGHGFINLEIRNAPFMKDTSICNLLPHGSSQLSLNVLNNALGRCIAEFGGQCDCAGGVYEAYFTYGPVAPLLKVSFWLQFCSTALCPFKCFSFSLIYLVFPTYFGFKMYNDIEEPNGEGCAVMSDESAFQECALGMTFAKWWSIADNASFKRALADAATGSRAGTNQTTYGKRALIWCNELVSGRAMQGNARCTLVNDCLAATVVGAASNAMYSKFEVRGQLWPVTKYEQGLLRLRQSLVQEC
jgi:hypothetical protein